MLKQFRYVFVCIIFAGVLLSLATPSVVGAASCGGTDTTIIGCSSKGGNSIWEVLKIVINILSVGVGIVAVGGYVYAAVLYTTAEDKSEQTNKAKDTILNTTIGLVIFALMFSGLQFIIPGGIFNRELSSLGDKKASINTPPPKKTNVTNAGPKVSSDYTSAKASVAKCYNVTNMSGREIQGRMYHKSGNKTYAFENSPQGIRYAANRGFKSIDLDIRVTKDGVPVATHWGTPLMRDGFYDPLHKIPKTMRLDKMTYAQASRLQHKDGKSKIYSLEHLIGVLKNNNMNLSLEYKVPIALSRKLPEITAQLNRAGVKASIKGPLRKAGMNQALTDARANGFWTRGTQGSQGWKAANGCKS